MAITWETAETDEEERYQTLKRHILRSPVSIVTSYQTKKKNCDVYRAKKKKRICDVIRDVIAPCPVIGWQINGRNLGTTCPINIKPWKGTSTGPQQYTRQVSIRSDQWLSRNSGRRHTHRHTYRQTDTHTEIAGIIDRCCVKVLWKSYLKLVKNKTFPKFWQFSCKHRPITALLTNSTTLINQSRASLQASCKLTSCLGGVHVVWCLSCWRFWRQFFGVLFYAYHQHPQQRNSI